MRFLDSRGTLVRGRRFPQQADITGTPDITKLAELVKKAYARIQELEAKSGPEAMEQEFASVTNGTTLTIEHGYNSPVRFWVTFSGASYDTNGVRGSEPDGAITLRVDSSSTVSRLVLVAITASAQPYKLVVRVEPSQYGVKQ